MAPWILGECRLEEFAGNIDREKESEDVISRQEIDYQIGVMIFRIVL
jgi:hypothetical protein